MVRRRATEIAGASSRGGRRDAGSAGAALRASGAGRTDAAGSRFPRTTGRTPGYDSDQVDAFLEAARAAFDTTDPRGKATSRPGGGDADPVPSSRTPSSSAVSESRTVSTISAESIRSMAFDVRRGGYSPVRVDAALVRLEEAFAEREREARRTELGDGAWSSEVRGRAQELLDRLDRAAGLRFQREHFPRRGYDVREVDAFAEALVRYFRDDELVTAEEVRAVMFQSRRKGYNEAQVDRVLDAVVDVMLSVD